MVFKKVINTPFHQVNVKKQRCRVSHIEIRTTGVVIRNLLY